MKSDETDVSTQGNNTPNLTQSPTMPATPPPTVVRSVGAQTAVPNTTAPVVVRPAPPVKQPDPTPSDRGIGIDGPALQPGGQVAKPEDAPVAVAYAEDLTPWMKEDKWAKSAWLTQELPPKKSLNSNHYDQFVIDDLRFRYLQEETDFRSALNNFYNSPYFDRVVARRIIDLLQTAQQALDQDSCNPLNVKALLDLAEENGAWLYPPHYAKSMAGSMIADLKFKHNMWGSYLENELNRDGQTLGGLRTAINLVKEQINKEKRIIQIGNGLQIDRLRMLINYGLIVMVLMLAGLPFFLFDKSPDIISKTFLGSSYVAKGWQWLSVASFAAIGAIGSFLSGLLQIRRSHVTLGDFKESMIQFKLRPIVGALVASLAAVLLITKVSGVTVDGVGGFLLIIFVCGFSERYFLNLFKISDDAAAPAQPVQPPTVDMPADTSAPVEVTVQAAPGQSGEPHIVRPALPRKAVDNVADVNTRKL